MRITSITTFFFMLFSNCHTQNPIQNPKAPRSQERNHKRPKSKTPKAPSPASFPGKDKGASPNTAPKVEGSPHFIFPENTQKLHFYRNGLKTHSGILMPSLTGKEVIEYPMLISQDHRNMRFVRSDHLTFNFNGVSIYWNGPSGTFMKPSIDTFLLCEAMQILFDRGFAPSTSVDIGTGSGFLAKYIAEKSSSKKTTAVDIDANSKKYINSSAFGKAKKLGVQPITQDAIEYLNTLGSIDYIVSNPPYIATQEEVDSPTPLQPSASNFWQSAALPTYLLNNLHKLPKAQMTLLFTSLTVSSKAFRTALEDISHRYDVELLLKREIVWKKWFAGGQAAYFQTELNNTYTINEVEYLDGGSKDPRTELPKDETAIGYKGYYWQVVYVMHFTPKAKR